MKEKLQQKIRYYTGQYEKAVESWLDTNRRNERERVIRTKERVKVLKECLELLNEER